MSLGRSAAIAALFLAFGSRAHAQNVVAGDEVRLSVEVRDWTPAAKVRVHVTIVDGPDSLRDLVREMNPPFGLKLPARTSLRVLIEPVAAAPVTIVRAQLLRAGAIISEGSMTSMGALVSVDQGTLSLSATGPGLMVWRLF